MSLTSLNKITSRFTKFIKRLNIGEKGATTRSSDPMLNINRNVDSTISGNGHCFSDSSTITRGNSPSYASYDCRIVVADNGDTYNHFAPFQNGIEYTGGSTSISYGFVDVPTMKGDANIGVRYGTYVADVAGTGTGTLTSNYGLYVKELTRGSVQNFAVVTKGATKSLFEGEVIFQGGITASSKITANSLQVTSGNVQMDRECFARTYTSLYGGGWTIDGSVTSGLRLSAGEGSQHDLAFMVQDQTSFILTVPTGTNDVKLYGSIGFFSATPKTKQVVTGSHGGNAALISLLTALNNYGLIDNQTTA